ncbi:MAG: hypothetical protein M0036_10005 [Desulfobacteraceae bacterium]|nr:hypothetical protein [Desulfobacteraceae bacterium]
MKDDRGLYYFPFPTNKRVRMYVRRGPTDIEFRIWNQDDPHMWDSHGWVPYGAIEQAQAMYKGGFDTKRAYDLRLAQTLIDESMA